MTTFSFRLQKVLDWRRTRLELAEARFRQQAAALGALDRNRAELAASGVRTELDVRAWNPVTDRDLEALGEFRLHLRAREAELARRRQECQIELAARERAMLEARRHLRLLERLRERRLAEWTKEHDRELEELASESYLARWRTAAPTYNEMHDP